MRLILVDSARRRLSQKRCAGKKVQLEEGIAYSHDRAAEFLDLSDAIDALNR